MPLEQLLARAAIATTPGFQELLQDVLDTDTNLD